MTQRTLRFGSLATLLAIALLIGAHPEALTQPADHSIVLTLDETSIGDLRIREHALQDGIDGDEVSPALRKVAMSALGETWITLESRIDESGTSGPASATGSRRASRSSVATARGCVRPSLPDTSDS